MNVLASLSKNVLWMCDSCICEHKQTKNSVTPQSHDNSCDVGKQPISRTTSIEDDIRELKTNVSEILRAIASNSNIPKTISLSATSASSASNDINSDPSTPVSSHSSHNGSIVCGCISSTLRGDDQQQPPRQPQSIMNDSEFALLITNVDVSVSERDIQRMASRAIGIQDPEHIGVTKLVSKWKCRKLDYISFKLVFDLKFKSRAMNSMTWPKNIKFREFVQRNNDVWRPT